MTDDEMGATDDVRREWESDDRAYGGDPAYAEGTIPAIRHLPVFDAIPVVRLNYIRDVARGHVAQDPMWISARLLLLCDQVEALQAQVQNEIAAREAARAEAVAHYNTAGQLRDEHAATQNAEAAARRQLVAALGRVAALETALRPFAAYPWDDRGRIGDDAPVSATLIRRQDRYYTITAGDVRRARALLGKG